MTGSKNGNETEAKSPRESGEDSEDESEILEESPCGRWSKRRQEVQQRDVPGIDAAYLAMDTDEGMEVVWNEVRFSERRNFREQEEKIRLVFDNLTQLDHPNIVKLHKYWIDSKNDKPRVVFITEYMSSGSLKKFLKLTKKNVKKLPLQSWKRWCTQILSALSYLHSCSPPIIHGNLTTDTIFIQHNGLVKIGSVAPDQIHSHVKTCRDDMKNMHFIAPEYGNSSPVTPAVDIYSFGMAALEMAALEIPGNGDSGNVVTQEQVLRTIHSLEHEQQRDFIQQCLNPEQSQRPSTAELLFHPVLFEVHSLKLLAAHALIHNPKKSNKFIDNCVEDMLQHQYHSDSVVAEITHSSGEPTLFRMADIPVIEKLEKFIEDVRLQATTASLIREAWFQNRLQEYNSTQNLLQIVYRFGIYPLTAFRIKQQPPSRPRAISPEAVDPVASETPETTDMETRKVINMMCNIKPNENGHGLFMTISLRLEDKMNRQLSCVVEDGEGAAALTDELVRYGFISQMDKDEITSLIEDHLTRVRNGSTMTMSMGRTGSLGNPLQNEDGLSVMHTPTITTATR
ncbi:nuclear receptor-binding protein-like [Cherax quadricarinatus]|uniref:nuclear receptor-binding protein-like n=1 Tax=Cherax quadricarinatus TaxID=27406 RepID=UPI002378A70D|nr:nuclear receptor-binding protein-like isoform X1 [Cherax quadricarinatus]